MCRELRCAAIRFVKREAAAESKDLKIRHLSRRQSAQRKSAQRNRTGGVAIRALAQVRVKRQLWSGAQSGLYRALPYSSISGED